MLLEEFGSSPASAFSFRPACLLQFANLVMSIGHMQSSFLLGAALQVLSGLLDRHSATSSGIVSFIGFHHFADDEGHTNWL